MDKTQEIFESLVTSLRENGDTFASSILLEEVKTGLDIPKSHLKKIAKYTRTEPDPESVYTFPVLMIDTAPTRNKVIYTEASQKKSVKSWPGTTYLFNATGNAAGWMASGADHALQASSQIARIYDAQVVKTPKGLIGTLGWVYTVKGTESTDDFVHKVESGILREVSIHVSVPDGVECSLCNDAFSNCVENTKTKANPKGTYHYPGETYNGKTAYMSTGQGALVPLELSNVACPGSVNAHIMQDDEVNKYEVVSLREALGGSRETIEQITKENEMKSTEARVKLMEAALAAGVTLREAVEDEKNKELSEAADTDNWTTLSEMPKAKKGDGDNDGDDKGMQKQDPPEDDKEKKQSANPAALFEGDCPVCLRGASKENSEPADVAKLREEYKAIVVQVTSEARKSIDALTEQVNSLKDGGLSDLLEDFLNQTVDVAIECGAKKVEDRNAYRETLSKLPYAAVKEIREGFKLVTAPKIQAEKTRLETSMQERLREQNGATRIETDSSGKKVARLGRKPSFAISAK